jgi:ubiquinone/menaquinone biosynthesis C-methylase UbiE
MSPLLLATKPYVPRARPNLVPRPRLIARLNDGLRHPLTLVSAPAGFGKTTLLSEWIPQSERCVAWVSLDEGDNDLTRFWAYVISVLQGLKASLGEKTLSPLQSPQPVPLESSFCLPSNSIAMSVDRIDYDVIAPTYDERYAVNRLDRVASALRSLTQQVGAGRILEVGCGTGRWLAELSPFARWVHGLDRSVEMLRKAKQREERFYLTRGQASQLPFPDAIFDLIFCVNALHHFDHPDAFICEAHRALRSGGALAIIGMEPPRDLERWYLYKYFEGTYEADLRRFPSAATVLDWMNEASFDRMEWRLVERIVNHKTGREILEDPFLQKQSTSQLVLLTDEAYAAGLSRMKAAWLMPRRKGRG